MSQNSDASRSLRTALSEDQINLVEALRVASRNGDEWATSEEVAEVWRELFGVPCSKVGAPSIGSSLGRARLDGAPIEKTQVNGQPMRWKTTETL